MHAAPLVLAVPRRLTPTDVASHTVLGIAPEILEFAQVHRVDDAEARDLLALPRYSGDLAGIVFPYVNPKTGRPWTYRVRRDHPEIEDGRPKAKYLSAHGDRKRLYFPPGCADSLSDVSIPVVAVEAEKSVLAVTSAAGRLDRAVLAIGLGGCWGWRGKIGKATDANGATVDETGPLPDLDLITWTGRDVVIAFDTNAASNPSVQAARRMFAKELTSRGATVRIADIPVGGGVNGPDDYVGRHGDAEFFAIADAAAPEEASAVVIQGGKLSEIVDRAEVALVAATSIYQRGGQLTRVITLDSSIGQTTDVLREAGSTMLVAVREPWLVEQMGRTMQWLRLTPATTRRPQTHTPIDPPLVYARTLLARGEWRFPVLRGLVKTPTLTRDGRVIETPGYDAVSGLLLDFAPHVFPPVPRSPSRDDARAALARLCRPLRGFPFVDGDRSAAQSVALSAMLTAVIRLSLRTAPLHGYDAPTAGTGKSLLAEGVGLLASGVRPPALAQGKSEEEDEKRLSTILFAGDAVIHLDNCDRPISGDFLCSMLTQEVVQARILGQSERRVLPTTALILASGNNLTFAGDTSRRVVICRLDAKVERPDTRTFDFDFHEEMLAQRADLVVAALTVLRAYDIAGRPERVTPMGSFADWAWVRGALVWLDYPDPAETRESIIESDPRKDELLTVIDMWNSAIGNTAIEVAHIAARADAVGSDTSPAANAIRDLRTKLQEVACRGGQWSGKSVGWWLRRNKDRVVDGCYLSSESARNGQQWRLVRTAGMPEM